MAYGKELILDLYGCDVSKFNRESIEEWLDKLCELIGMQQEDLHWWDYEGVPKGERSTEAHLLGTSAVQFITTSDIVIHTLDMLGECYINIFSCKDFDSSKAVEFTKDWFGAEEWEHQTIVRGSRSKCNNISVRDCTSCSSFGKCSGPGWVQKPCFGKELEI